MVSNTTSSSGNPSPIPITTTSNTSVATISIPTLNPTTTTTTTTTTTNFYGLLASAPQIQSPSQPRPPQFLQHHHQQRHHQLQPPQQLQQHQHGIFTAQNPTPNQNQTPILYPLASSGRGLLPTPRGIRAHLANHGISRPFAPSDSSQHSHHLIRAPFLNPLPAHMTSVSVPAATGGAVGGGRGISVPNTQPKAAASSPYSPPNCNGHRGPVVNKGGSDFIVTVKDRKVRISDGASLYSLCRSWLKNGYVEETQPQYVDVITSLPKPSPMPTTETSPRKRKESDDVTGDEEDGKSVEDLSAKELLQRHIKRAKRVRARLREERSQRIERYKNRLALLLPPLMEQCGNDTITGS